MYKGIAPDASHRGRERENQTCAVFRRAVFAVEVETKRFQHRLIWNSTEMVPIGATSGSDGFVLGTGNEH